MYLQLYISYPHAVATDFFHLCPSTALWIFLGILCLACFYHDSLNNLILNKAKFLAFAMA